MTFTLDTTLDMSELKNLEKSLRGIKKKHIKYGWYEGKTFKSQQYIRTIR